MSFIVACLLFCREGAEEGEEEQRGNERSQPPGGRVLVTLAEGGTLTQQTEPPADTKVGPPPMDNP